MLAFLVERTSGLVEDENTRAPDESTRYSQPLLLTARQLTAEVADDGVQTVLEVENEASIGEPKAIDNDVIADLTFARVTLVRNALQYIFSDALVEQDGLLTNVADHASQFSYWHVLYVFVVN